ncbi:alkaline phosphatase D family protein [Solirubrobacter phytolaccae]|uniref:Alkaline phosphatase D family protein n=1 Tax=Solirubrobacter phytolaccae TaxID=1404360 RepID=A0A9X3SAS7_9ACTN|nr:alkaline phosphatase D family protein [Solirubrobacter phytolaccae]MDA0184789.1 alkaline phosphatase D family protein [Solirubrobacter phytolaccae]
MHRRLTRRELVVAASVAGAYAFVPKAFGRIVERPAEPGPGRFLDGVASGEPSHDAVTFWSRLSTERPVSGARLIVAADEGLSRTVATVVVPTSRSVDGTLKCRVNGLEPGRHYWYVWEGTEDVSPVGRTKTAPAPDSRAAVAVGFSSCQNYADGYFNAHRDAAGTDLDLYVFLGDYTYEYDEPEGLRPDVASTDLHTYRSKLQLYRQDPDLRELHRLHPVVHIWDDHEVADNYSDGDPAPSALQRDAGYRASFEWLPRMAMPSERTRIYKSLKLGRTAELALLDQRQYRTASPKSMLGRPQLDWLKSSLSASDARWKLIGNQAMFTPLRVANAIPVNTDQWDGYVDERAELEAHIAGGIDDVVFLTGDIHLFVAADTRVLPSQSFATEYVGGSVTSTGLPDALEGIDEPVIIANNLNMRYFDGTAHGWARAEIGDAGMDVEYRASDITTKGAPARTLARFHQTAGENRVESAGSSAAPKARGSAAPRKRTLQKAIQRDLNRRTR